MRSPGNTAVALAAGAAVATGLAVGLSGYEQVSKRMPRYRQQQQLLKEVGWFAGLCLRSPAAVPAGHGWGIRLILFLKYRFTERSAS